METEEEANYRKMFLGLPSVIRGQFEVEVSDDLAPNPGGDGTMGLYKCTYSVDQLKSDAMVKKGSKDHPISEEQYVFLHGLNQHHNALLIENYYKDENNHACLVVEAVTGPFQCWLNYQHENRGQLFTDDGRMGMLLRGIILSLCSFVEDVLDKSWYPQHLTMDNLYIKMLGGEPTLKVLLSDVKEGATKRMCDSTWDNVRQIIKECCTLYHVTLNTDSTSFCHFLGYQNQRTPLEHYPDAWSDDDKVTYLRLIIQSDIRRTKQYVRNSGIKWPKNDDGMLGLIIKEDKVATYNTQEPLDYIRLCRNITKKFSVPEQLKAQIKDCSGFLRKMEEWTPNIWSKLYEYIGHLAG